MRTWLQDGRARAGDSLPTKELVLFKITQKICYLFHPSSYLLTHHRYSAPLLAPDLSDASIPQMANYSSIDLHYSIIDLSLIFYPDVLKFPSTTQYEDKTLLIWLTHYPLFLNY